MSGRQCKNSSDMAGIGKKLQLLNYTTVLFKVPAVRLKVFSWDFSGDPWAKTLCTQTKEPGFHP